MDLKKNCSGGGLCRNIIVWIWKNAGGGGFVEKCYGFEKMLGERSYAEI